MKKTLLPTILFIAVVMAYIAYWDVGTYKQADPLECAEQIVCEYGSYMISQLNTIDTPEGLTPIKSYPMIWISTLKDVVFEPTSDDLEGHIVVRLYNPHGLGWKLWSYSDNIKEDS